MLDLNGRSAARSAVQFVADHICTMRTPHDVVVCGITGADACGKTHLTDLLARQIASRFPVTIVHVDDFHNPRAVRYSGSDPAESYLSRSIDFQRLIDQVLRPLSAHGRLRFEAALLNLGTDAFENNVRYEADPGTIVLVEGVFLARPDMSCHLDILVHLEAAEGLLRARGIARDRAHLGAAAEERYDRKYLPAQRRFKAKYRPADIADIVLDATDLDALVVKEVRPCGHRRYSFRHAIFDLNGTLANTKKMIANTRSAHLRRLAAVTDLPLDTIMAECRAFLARDSMNPDLSENLPSVQRWCAADSRHVQLLSDELLRFREHIVACGTPCSGVLRALTLLRRANVTISIWTGSRTPYVRDLLNLYGLAPLVDFLFCVPQRPDITTSLDHIDLDNVTVVELAEALQKPSSDALRAIVNVVKLPEEETILVGNSVAGDGLSCVTTRVRFVVTEWGQIDANTMNMLDELNGVESRKAAEKQLAFGSRTASVAHWRTLRSSLLELVSWNGVAAWS